MKQSEATFNMEFSGARKSTKGITMKHKAMKNLTPVILALILSGCNSNTSSPAPSPSPDPKPSPIKPINGNEINDRNGGIIVRPEDKEINNGSGFKPAVKKKPIPLFVADGIHTLTQQPYSGVITRGGDVWLRYQQKDVFFHNFKTPKWTPKYKYTPYLEVLITDGNEQLCTRYDWKSDKFGMAKEQCLWSNVADGVGLEDMKQAYYGFRVTEARVVFNGVVGLSVSIK